jgi:hypothetical protein
LPICTGRWARLLSILANTSGGKLLFTTLFTQEPLQSFWDKYGSG